MFVCNRHKHKTRIHGSKALITLFPNIDKLCLGIKVVVFLYILYKQPQATTHRNLVKQTRIKQMKNKNHKKQTHRDTPVSGHIPLLNNFISIKIIVFKIF